MNTKDKPVKVEWWANEFDRKWNKKHHNIKLKSFIRSLLSEQKEEIISEIAQYSPIPAKATRDLLKIISKI